MEYRIEESAEDDFWHDVKMIKLGYGRFYYVYFDDKLSLCVQVSEQYCFTEAIIFHDHLVIGNYGNGVYFINLHDFEVRQIEIEFYFGYLKVDRDVLYVLGAWNVRAFNADLELLWKTPNVAIDGVVFKGIEGDTMKISCEMDPPGHWVDRTISLPDGSVIG